MHMLVINEFLYGGNPILTLMHAVTPPAVVHPRICYVTHSGKFTVQAV